MAPSFFQGPLVMNSIAWLFAVVGGLLACLLLGMECVGRKMPVWIPFKKYIWWLSVWVFFLSVLSIMFSNI